MPLPDVPPMPAPTLVASTGGVEVAVYDLGGEGPDVLMVHATGFCGAVWLPLAAALGRARVVLVDVRGHGRSSVPAAGMDWHGTAADVLAAVDDARLDRPVGVGHSMGGASLVLAEQARPGTFAGLWLFEPIIFPPELRSTVGTGSNPLAAGARRRRERFDSAEDAVAHYAAKPPLSTLAPAALAAYVTHGFAPVPDGGIALRCRPSTEAATYEMGGRHDAFEHLGSVACPTVVLRGAAGSGGPAALAPGIAGALGDGALEEHPDLGHFGPLEAPEAMADSVRALLDRVAD